MSAPFMNDEIGDNRDDDHQAPQGANDDGDDLADRQALRLGLVWAADLQQRDRGYVRYRALGT